MAIALAFDEVSKDFGHRSVGLRETASAWLRRGSAGDDNYRTRALDQVSFAIAEGESVALVGDNGAGKTTALKIATRVAYPTHGRVSVRGRIGALIEVGTGMHPELTGRENIQLYGSIMGLSRSEIAGNFDEIVDFSGVERALDRPLKQFSSGMQLRLGFAVAAHLDPDLLIVDEAIAVGDQNFQHKCVERMSEMVRQGRTLVFVSHDMFAVESLCARAIWLRSGQLMADDKAPRVIRDYLASTHDDRVAEDLDRGRVAGEGLSLTAVTLHDRAGRDVEAPAAGEPLTVRLHYRTDGPVERPGFSVGITDGRLGCFTVASMLVDGNQPELVEGEGFVDCSFDDLPLSPQAYELWGSVRTVNGYSDHIPWQRLRRFRVTGDVVGEGAAAATLALTVAPVQIPHRWKA